MGQLLEMTLCRSEDLRKLVNEINYRRINQGKRRLTTNEIAKHLIKDKEQIINEFIQL